MQAARHATDPRGTAERARVRNAAAGRRAAGGSRVIGHTCVMPRKRDSRAMRVGQPDDAARRARAILRRMGRSAYVALRPGVADPSRRGKAEEGEEER